MIENIDLYLPKYLSAEAEKILLSEIRAFPENIDTRLFTTYLQREAVVFQGDGLRQMPIVDLTIDSEIKYANAMVFSNTCDIDPDNKRNFPSQIVYAPIIALSKYENLLRANSKKSSIQIDDHIADIKRQRITQIFYLPKSPNGTDASIVFLDRTLNVNNEFVSRDELPNRRIFTLSDYGIYLFITKLSIHFTRIQDKVERRAHSPN